MHHPAHSCHPLRARVHTIEPGDRNAMAHGCWKEENESGDDGDSRLKSISKTGFFFGLSPVTIRARCPIDKPAGIITYAG